MHPSSIASLIDRARIVNLRAFILSERRGCKGHRCSRLSFVRQACAFFSKVRWLCVHTTTTERHHSLRESLFPQRKIGLRQEQATAIEYKIMLRLIKSTTPLHTAHRLHTDCYMRFDATCICRAFRLCIASSAWCFAQFSPY